MQNVRQAKENALANAFSRSPSGLKYSTARHQPGRGSDLISHFKGAQKVVLLCRASSRQQTNSPDQQEQAARGAVRALGGRVVGVFKGVENSTSRGRELPEVLAHEGRDLLVRAIQCATTKGAVLVATERDRFLRTSTYEGRIKHPKTGHDLETPTIAEFEWLIEQAGTVPLATIAHPDAPARGQQTRRGLNSSVKPVGRPGAEKRGAGCYVRRRKALIEDAWKMRQLGLSFRKIAQELNRRGWPEVSPKTVHNWCRKLGV